MLEESTALGAGECSGWLSADEVNSRKQRGLSWSLKVNYYNAMLLCAVFHCVCMGVLVLFAMCLSIVLL